MTKATELNLAQGRSESTDIRIRGAQQNNLKHIDLDIHTGTFTVVTGPSGSGKSSLAFDTLYAEGQRRYVETFSPYARQFLDRCDRPQVESIDGVPPAIAIEQTNSVRTSRSTVGTMTELNDHIKLLFSRQADAYCPKCGRPIRDMTPAEMAQDLRQWAKEFGNPRVFVTFDLTVPKNFSKEEALNALSAQGYTHVEEIEEGVTLRITADRFRLDKVDDARLSEALTKALEKAQDNFALATAVDDAGQKHEHPFAKGLTCAFCRVQMPAPTPSQFSFNSAVGACPVCRGFGKTLGVDMGLVIPDTSLSLFGGAVKPFKRTGKTSGCYKDMCRLAKKYGIPIKTPFCDLTEEQQRWVIEGADDWDGDEEYTWYGVRNWFKWVEQQAGYKVGMRMILSRYRTETTCPECSGARLKPTSLFWRVGSLSAAQETLAGDDDKGQYKRFRPAGMLAPALNKLNATPGLTVQDLMDLPVTRLKKFFDKLKSEAKDAACAMVIDEIITRLDYLCDVGLGYLTLGRQSRTLSGGEVQRVNLTTALGTNLTDTLFVLDEPSVGLHPRDMDRVNSILSKLKNAGNTLVVVEHDPQVMLSADRIIDMGPGAGQAGGSIVFDGPTKDIRTSKSLTSLYLSGSLTVDHNAHVYPNAFSDWVTLSGAREHNLKSIDFKFPLHTITTVTGVSGSGKSTLVADILVPAIQRRLGKSVVAGEFDQITGINCLSDVVFVDQSAIGTSTRATPVTFVGAFDSIRSLFASAPLAQTRGYSPATFSFNTGTGRCPACQGSGFEIVEMQFLSDIHVRCEVCNGTRYRPETLEIKINFANRGLKNIADVLDMTVDQALAYFQGCSDIVNRLEPLQEVGMGYIKLGQPLSTVSGGEAQRLKLAEILAQSRTGAKKHVLYVFDEPTTGLHFCDIEKLLRALRRLVQAGQSVLTVEHNLDMIGASDWIVDLGPEGGDEGGKIVFEGTPDDISGCKESYTGQALSAYREMIGREDKNMTGLFAQAAPSVPPAIGRSMQSVWRRARRDDMGIFGAREHNLKNIDVVIPKRELTVVSGVSGSGKSTLAFGVIFSEGQRRYLDSLNAYARSIAHPPARPEVDRVTGIAPTVSIEQRTSRGGRKSTVSTLTEIQHFLRLIYVTLGVQYCPKCHIPVTQRTEESIVAEIMRVCRDKTVTITAPVVKDRKGAYTELAARFANEGVKTLYVDGRWVPTEPFPTLRRYSDHSIEVPVATLVIEPENENILVDAVTRAVALGDGVVNLKEGSSEAGSRRPRKAIEATYSTKLSCPQCGRSFPEPDPRLFSFNSAVGWCPMCHGTGLDSHDHSWIIFRPESAAESTADYSDSVCPFCHGKRLNNNALNVLFHDLSIADVTALSVDDCLKFVEGIALAGREKVLAEPALKEVASRLLFLQKVGLGYMCLDRDAPSLSGGEAQRIRLASQLGSTLQGVCYVLDEPTIGLHARDNKLLIDTLTALKNKGNTVIVVEHDEEMIRRADHIIDIGPLAGSQGGRVMSMGSVEELLTCEESLTARMLKHPVMQTGVSQRPVTKGMESIHIKNANFRNLKNLSVDIPLNRLTVLTGVSGSGKSTLARDVLLNNLCHASDFEQAPNLHCDSISGFESLSRVYEVDQTPIGKTPRSCPATYVGFFNKIRDLYASTNEAKERGFGPGQFSFNKEEGNCPVCGGQGEVLVAMSFLPDVKVCCEACHGMRFSDETLQVKWRDKSIGDILNMSVDEATEFFAAMPSVLRPLKLMQDVGLGYLKLGQPSSTLSGGEAQRIKLVYELSKSYNAKGVLLKRSVKTIYVLDEPTVGLHMADVEKLVAVLHRLVEAGNTVLVIEHNLDVIVQADHVIDLGPEGGPAGGTVVGQGQPCDIAKLDTPTGRAIAAYLAEHASGAQTALKSARKPRAKKSSKVKAQPKDAS